MGCRVGPLVHPGPLSPAPSCPPWSTTPDWIPQSEWGGEQRDRAGDGGGMELMIAEIRIESGTISINIVDLDSVAQDAESRPSSQL